MATEMSIPLTLRDRRMADRNYEIGDIADGARVICESRTNHHDAAAEL